MVENKLDLIFKAYDVRGIYGQTLTNDIAYNIGTAFSQFVESETIIVGHDDIFESATGIYTDPQGIAYIIKPLGKSKFQLIANILPSEWANL